ncbi:GntR family transcriptional regulator [Falsiroseomonas sp. E2-1-a20]|uniref:GntR family transcriptional regulator n=1 Tax=Falsiroseomonas sp. E2-1-a20 TaxID=3239300 RepID=UPI003F2A6AAB
MLLRSRIFWQNGRAGRRLPVARTLRVGDCVHIEHYIHARKMDVTSGARRQGDVEEAERLLGSLQSAPASLSEQTYQRLRSLIIEGGFAPGTVVTERRVADAAGISRTPMRAAIARLKGEGLVTRLGNGSVVIRSFSLDEVLQNLRVRRLLETEAAALAALRLDPARLGPMRDEAEAFCDERDADFERFWAHDDALHALIAQGCGVPLLASLIADLRAKARMCNLARMPPQFTAQGHEHVQLIDALARGDAVAARKAMDVHFDKVGLRLVGWVDPTPP